MGATYSFADADGVVWTVTVTGPTHVGNTKEGEDVTRLPEMWFARYSRPRRAGELVIDLAAEETDVVELRRLLEDDPEWAQERDNAI